MIFDLHTHSNASDGLLSPEELLARAGLRGVKYLALTDHDTVAGVRELQSALAAGNFATEVQLVPGVEITASLGRRDYHVLGLWLDIDNPALDQFLAGQASVRNLRAEKIDRRLQRQGVTGALDGAKEIAQGGLLSRPHFARYLVAAGYCKKEQQAYKRWLGPGKSCDVHCEWPAVETAIGVIHQSGGVAVLAHPSKYRLTRTRLIELLQGFKAAGGDGLELISGAQEESTTQELLKLAEKHDLACSLGSDFHSPEQVWCDIGSHKDLPSDARPIWLLDSVVNQGLPRPI